MRMTDLVHVERVQMAGVSFFFSLFCFMSAVDRCENEGSFSYYLTITYVGFVCLLAVTYIMG